MCLVGVGLALGLVAGYGSSTAIGRFLFAISPHDILTFSIVPCVLAGVGLVAF